MYAVSYVSGVADERVALSNWEYCDDGGRPYRLSNRIMLFIIHALGVILDTSSLLQFVRESNKFQIVNIVALMVLLIFPNYL